MKKSPTKKITVRLDLSTWRWLQALARANKSAEILMSPSTPAGLLEQAAFCFADAAGRRTGSWEADVGRSMLVSSGFQEELSAADHARCARADERANQLARAAWEEKRRLEDKKRAAAADGQTPEKS
jgi:hypothetical protein